MTFDWNEAEKDLAGGIDVTVPNSARVWDYWLGGKDSYEADRRAGETCALLYPGITDTIRTLRYFTARAVRSLAADAGIRQFLDIGTGLPFRDPVHQVALAAAPDCRIAYVDNDALVLAHARALLTGPPGTVAYIEASLEDPAGLLAAAGTCLDFTEPLAIILVSTLGHIGDPGQDDDQAARAITRQLADALPAGGYLAIGDLVTHPELDTALGHYNSTGAAPYRTRSPRQFTRLFTGLDLTELGTGPARAWRPDPSPFPGPEMPAWSGVGRKTKTE